MDKKVTFNKKELAALIKKKYQGATVRLLNENHDVFVFILSNLTPYEMESVILIYYRSPEIPFQTSFEFYTKNKYFAVPI